MTAVKGMLWKELYSVQGNAYSCFNYIVIEMVADYKVRENEGDLYTIYVVYTIYTI